MTHFRNKNDLLAWLENHCPRKAIQTALIGGEVELLGVFGGHASKSYPLSWIIKVISKRRTVWNVVIIPEVLGKGHHVFTVSSIPWEDWVGDEYTDPLLTGDFPEKYKELRDETGTD